MLTYIAWKKEVGKMAIFGPKPLVNPFGKKGNFSTFWTSFFFYSRERSFFVPEYNIVKDIFLPYFADKKEVGKMTIFEPKPWVNRFGKKGNFSTFWTSFFYNLQRSFFVSEYRKILFAALFCQKKKSWKNDQFWTKTMG